MTPKNVWILGSTGSIGTQALDVIARNSESFQVAGLGAGGGQPDLLARQAAQFNVPVVAIAQARAGEDFSAAFHHYAPGRPMPELLLGATSIAQLAGMANGTSTSLSQQDVVLNGVTGSVGLEPTLAALATGATLALANKESLVVGGTLVEQAMCRPGQIVPVDSEHSAIFQALQAGTHHRGLTSANRDGRSNVRRIILTASGGPFRGRKRCELENVTLEQALNHPTWSMGTVVTINSATMMNKALELIEAAYLFAVPPNDIVPVIHPQSAVHSMVEFSDGSTVMQGSPPDMRLPIALGLSWPERTMRLAAPTFDWAQAHTWDFEPLDNDAFPAVQMARSALAAGPLFPVVMNAANEQAVEAFVRGQMSFLGITDTVACVLDAFAARRESDEGGAGAGSATGAVCSVLTLAQVRAVDQWARNQADALIARN